MSGADIGNAVIGMVGDCIKRSPNQTGPTLAEVSAAFDHIDATKTELREALAYTAAQVHAYKRIANQEAALAIYQIESIVNGYRNRRAEPEEKGGT